MSDTPKTEEAKFSGIHAHPSEEYVDADYARELERENTRLTKDLDLRTAERDGARAERNHYMAKAGYSL
jgi:hypothetical protein